MSNTDLRLSYDVFLKNILAIKNLSDELNDGWEFEGDMEQDYNAYLKKKIIRNFDVISPSDLQSEIQDISDTEILENSKKCIIVYEYHVAYSISYGVPLLCLNMWDIDGKRLSMEEAWKYFDKKYIQDNMYSVLTQQDHPVLQVPFMVLHPCKTNEILENISLKSKNPVISLLSSIGPAVNLNLSNEYEKLTRNVEETENL